MLAIVFRSFFLIAIISWYSTGIWRLIDEYFRKEFSTYLSSELKKSKLQPAVSELDHDQNGQVKPKLPSSVLYANLFGETTVKSKKAKPLKNHVIDGNKVNYAANDDANVKQKLKPLTSSETIQTERLDRKITRITKAIDSGGGGYCYFNELNVFGMSGFSFIDNDATDMEQNDLINYWKVARKSHQPQLNHRDNGFCELTNSEC